MSVHVYPMARTCLTSTFVNPHFPSLAAGNKGCESFQPLIDARLYESRQLWNLEIPYPSISLSPKHLFPRSPSPEQVSIRKSVGLFGAPELEGTECTIGCPATRPSHGLGGRSINHRTKIDFIHSTIDPRLQ